MLTDRHESNQRSNNHNRFLEESLMQEVGSASAGKKPHLTIGHYLLAIMLLGALATQPSWAEEAASDASDTGAASSFAKASGSHQGSGADAAGGGAINHVPAEIGAGPKGESSSGPKGEHSGSPKGGTSGGVSPSSKADGSADVKGATARETHPGSKDDGVNPIETRITVQSPRTTKRSDKTGDMKTIVGTGAPGSFRAWHRISAPGAIGGVARNAIGLPVTNRAGAPPAAQMSGPNSSGVAAGSVVGGMAAATDVSGPKLVHQNAGPIATAAVTNRANISGIGLARPGYGPGVIGGPAKVVSGINGTSLRPKH
jgi:hypothetical protein